MNGKITERVKKISKIILDAAKIRSVPKKKLNKRNKTYWDEELSYKKREKY